MHQLIEDLMFSNEPKNHRAQRSVFKLNEKTGKYEEIFKEKTKTEVKGEKAQD